jgi:prepilin-type processing-associated H-X9-DG protein
MYKIRGADQKEYGPVTADQIRHWISEGRANAQTRVQPAGSTEWQDLGSIPEFAGQFAPAPPSLSAATPTAAPAGIAKTSGLAVTALVFGILGFFTCGLTALPGLIIGVIAIVKVNKSNGALKGTGLAIGGTILSAISLIMLPILAAVLLPALMKAKQSVHKAQAEGGAIRCVSNVQQLALAIRIYSTDNTNHFPSAATWCDAVKSQVGSEKVFRCPLGDAARRCDYAFNARLDGIEDSGINGETVLLFETDGGWNASGGPELLLRTPRHGGVVVVAFADGSVRQIPPEQLVELRWNP